MSLNTNCIFVDLVAVNLIVKFAGLKPQFKRKISEKRRKASLLRGNKFEPNNDASK